MFQKTKNIDTSFRHFRLFAFVVLIASVLVSVFAIYKSYELASRVQSKIYVLANGKALEAYAADRKDNIPVEIRDHVKTFHQLFFTLDPDDKVIQTHIQKALYLADGSAKRLYDNLRESGYYASLISGNISQQLQVDSITVDTQNYPYYFSFTGQQKIIRPSTIIFRSLRTEGFIRHVSRSDNNPHGFLIEKWKTMENKDIKTENR